jgi:hypothetical protein
VGFRDDAMKSLVLAVALLTATAGLPAANRNPFFRIAQLTKNGKVRVTGINTARKSIVAYVVVAERQHKRVVWNGIYTGQDRLGAGEKITFDAIPVDSNPRELKVFVDYVRLADGTAWGEAQTDEARTAISRFQK